jgi:hypothetical protein
LPYTTVSSRLNRTGISSRTLVCPDQVGQAGRDIPQGSLVTLRWRGLDSNF